jgi:hypothetical protein
MGHLANELGVEEESSMFIATTSFHYFDLKY